MDLWIVPKLFGIGAVVIVVLLILYHWADLMLSGFKTWLSTRSVKESPSGGLVTTSSTRPPALNEEQVRLRDAIVTVAEGTTLSLEEVGSAARSMAQVGMGLNHIIENIHRIASDAPVWSELSFETRVQTMMAEAVTRDLDNSFINGTPVSASFPPSEWNEDDAAQFEEFREIRAGGSRLRRALAGEQFRCHRCRRTGIPIEEVCVKRYKDNRGTEIADFETLCRRCEEGVRKAHIVTEPEPSKIRVIRMGNR